MPAGTVGTVGAVGLSLPVAERATRCRRYADGGSGGGSGGGGSSVAGVNENGQKKHATMVRTPSGTRHQARSGGTEVTAYFRTIHLFASNTNKSVHSRRQRMRRIRREVQQQIVRERGYEPNATRNCKTATTKERATRRHNTTQSAERA